MGNGGLLIKILLGDWNPPKLSYVGKFFIFWKLVLKFCKRQYFPQLWGGRKSDIFWLEAPKKIFISKSPFPQNFLMWEIFLFCENRFWSFVSGHIFPYFGRGVVKVTFFDWRPLKRFLLVSPQFEREKLANSEINLLLQILEFCPEIWHVLMILKINTSSRSNFLSISKIFTLRVDFSTDFQTNFKIS